MNVSRDSLSSLVCAGDANGRFRPHVDRTGHLGHQPVAMHTGSAAPTDYSTQLAGAHACLVTRVSAVTGVTCHE